MSNYPHSGLLSSNFDNFYFITPKTYFQWGKSFLMVLCYTPLCVTEKDNFNFLLFLIISYIINVIISNSLLWKNKAMK